MAANPNFDVMGQLAQQHAVSRRREMFVKKRSDPPGVRRPQRFHRYFHNKIIGRFHSKDRPALLLFKQRTGFHLKQFG